MAKTTRSAKAGSGRSPTSAAKTARATTKATKTVKTPMRQGRQTAADMVVELPGGTARITIQAKAGVRRTAHDWLRLVEALAQASLSPGELREQLRPESLGQQMTPTEVNELEEAGARPASALTSNAVRADAVTWRVAVAVAAYDVADVADLLGVDPTRVRQRLRARTLYGLRGDGRIWRLPRFQFDDSGHEVPHLGQVLRVLPPDLHPRAVEGFLASPKAELMADGEARTPRDWLLSGGPVDPVLALATSLSAQ